MSLGFCPGKMQLMANPIVLGRTNPLRGLRVLGQYLAAGASLALLTWTGFILRLDLTTISFVYLLLVVSTALVCGF